MLKDFVLSDKQIKSFTCIDFLLFYLYDRWVASFMNLMEDLFVKEATQWVLEQLQDFLSQLMWVFSCYPQHTLKVKKNWILIWSSSSGWVIFQFLRHEVTRNHKFYIWHVSLSQGYPQLYLNLPEVQSMYLYTWVN